MTFERLINQDVVQEIGKHNRDASREDVPSNGKKSSLSSTLNRLSVLSYDKKIYNEEFDPGSG